MIQPDEMTDSDDYFTVMAKEAELEVIMEGLSNQFVYHARQEVCKDVNGPDCICRCHKSSETGNKPFREKLTDEEEHHVDILFMKKWAEWHIQQNVYNQYT